jgi:seryl-tRNA synthetase
MLDIKFIRENKELVKQNCQNRNVKKLDIDRLIAVDELRRVKMGEVEELRASRKAGSKGKPTSEEIEHMRALGETIKQKETELEKIVAEFNDLMMQVPNLTHPETPVGGEEDFKVLEEKPAPEFSFAPKDHEELLTNLNMIDFERGTKVAGAKFYFAKNDLVRLNQALINYGMDIATAHGFELMETPDLAKQDILRGIGFNPRGDETQIYSVENTDLSLIGTAEITVGGYHADEILDLSHGPKKYVALSHCFRTEAGAYGRTSKGLYRVHQFTKLEMFVYCKPEESDELHQEILAIEKEICDGLGLSYRVIDIASGDLGGPAYRKFDLEAWMSMKGDDNKAGDFGEITSTSNCTDYQARRLNIRYRTDSGETSFVHTLNGTAVVLSRFPIALVEQNQQANGTVTVPRVLHKYMGKEIIG